MSWVRYLSVGVIPAVAFVSILSSGPATFVALVVLFGVLPTFELVLHGVTTNLDDAGEAEALRSPMYDLMLRAMVPVQLLVVGVMVWRVSSGGLSTLELVGVTVSAGLCCGALGINGAHELGHRVNPLDRFLAKVMLATSLYLHFFIEHNRGHHKRAATPEDPASARRGEHLYAFLVRSIAGSWTSAWRLERDRLAKAGQGAWTWRNEMLWYVVIQAALVGGLYAAFGAVTAAAFVGAAFVGVLLLENVNYIEHYGLARRALGDGRYERVAPRHSWNSNHPLGRTMLFELTRHSDHHAVASRPYQVLRHHDEAPQLPTGYPGMMVLSWFPPLFFAVAHRAIERYEGSSAARLPAGA